MARENDCGTLVERILDCRESRFDALGVGDFARHLVLRNVKINADENALAFEIEIFNGKFCHRDTFF